MSRRWTGRIVASTRVNQKADSDGIKYVEGMYVWDESYAAGLGEGVCQWKVETVEGLKW